ncbi:hypothetical protein MMAG44476_14230 [Mycolicibacterium mageritense DSM 44476 = CIP 104973]|uniref:PPE domain-containing protein n=1 Tax=Mycolicibacterium mageritense TaxID=53462 RepID=A0ABM7HSS9_MYCME|nr:hypothetical protein [Mycolicibacterium mageritense]BBX33613.1 hypothetical protein MMAGJ_28950 [Mycolicibacterium mageritense]CDO22042.1 hypothetical protein BN978_02507 [Mycolicibacterium mageritense DSM 44476 = CIP 104973]
MTTNPYGTYAAILAEVAVGAEALGDDMNAAIGIAPDASGQTADAVNDGFLQNAQAMREIARAARDIATIAEDQGPADAMFAAAPTPDDIADAQQKVLDAKAKGAAPEEVRKAANHAADLATEREDARNAHAAASRRTAEALRGVVMPPLPTGSAPIPTVARGDVDSGNSKGAPRTGGQGQGQGDLNSGNGGGGGIPLDTSSSAGGSTLSDSDAGTALSADGSGVPMTAAQLAGQPQAMGQQPGAMGGQPQMAPMGQMGAVPSTGAGQLTDPKALAKAAAARNRKRDSGNGTPVAPVMSPMSFGGASGGGAVDRGSSTSGVTTAANTSGSLKTALSGAVVPPGTGQAPGMMGRGMGGGMMGGAPGAGGAGGGNSKERPTIYDAHRPDEVERSDSIQDGTLSRATAEDPNAVEERERQK